MLGEKELKKQKQAVGAHANDVNKLIDWLIFFGNCDWTRAWQAVMSNELSQPLVDQNSKKERFYFMFYRQNCLKTTQKIVSNGVVKRIQPYH